MKSLHLLQAKFKCSIDPLKHLPPPPPHPPTLFNQLEHVSTLMCFLQSHFSNFRRRGTAGNNDAADATDATDAADAGSLAACRR